MKLIGHLNGLTQPNIPVYRVDADNILIGDDPNDVDCFYPDLKTLVEALDHNQNFTGTFVAQVKVLCDRSGVTLANKGDAIPGTLWVDYFEGNQGAIAIGVDSTFYEKFKLKEETDVK